MKPQANGFPKRVKTVRKLEKNEDGSNSNKLIINFKSEPLKAGFFTFL